MHMILTNSKMSATILCFKARFAIARRSSRATFAVGLDVRYPASTSLTRGDEKDVWSEVASDAFPGPCVCVCFR